MTVGENIKKLRKEKGLTQKALADKLGCSQANLAQYETGKRIPKAETRRRIAKALDVEESLLKDDSFNDSILRFEKELSQFVDSLGEEEQKKYREILEFFEKLHFPDDKPLPNIVYQALLSKETAQALNDICQKSDKSIDTKLGGKKK